MAKSGKKPALGRGLSALLQDPNNDIKSAEDKNADNPYALDSCLFAEKTRKECHERPVSIDSSYEATVLNNARELERSLIRKDANMRASCEKVVRSMPSESAYRFYKSSSEPAH